MRKKKRTKRKGRGEVREEGRRARRETKKEQQKNKGNKRNPKDQMLLLLYIKKKKRKEKKTPQNSPARLSSGSAPRGGQRSLPKGQRPESAVCAFGVLGRVGVEPDSGLKFQGTGRTGVSALGSNEVCVLDVILDR